MRSLLASFSIVESFANHVFNGTAHTNVVHPPQKKKLLKPRQTANVANGHVSAAEEPSPD